MKKTEKVSRKEMLWATDMYFEGMEKNTGDIVPFDKNCNRTESGVQTTNNPDLMPPGSDYTGPNFGLMGCKEQFNLGGQNLWHTPERSIWMVDEERGLVLGNFMFTISGVPDTAFVLPGEGPVRVTMGGTLLEPSAMPIAELFKIKNGRIYEIEAVVGPLLAYGTRSGW